MTHNQNQQEQEIEKRQFEAARRYAQLSAKSKSERTLDDELFMQNYKAHVNWLTDGKGIAG